jgi:peptide/nickel transport system substrate-binding protein
VRKLASLSCLVVFCLAACSEDPANGSATPGGSAPPATDTLTIGISQYPATLHPIIDSMVAKSYVLGMASRGIVRFDHDWEVACSLCTELPTLENGAAEMVLLEDGTEGMKVAWELQDGMRWADGEPVTTADFHLTWEIGRHPAVGALGSEFWRTIQRIEIVDDRHMVLYLDRRVAGYNAGWILYPTPEHLERAVFEADPAEYRNRTLYQTDPATPGLWMGPYRVTEVTRGTSLALEKNPHWHGRPAHFDRIVVRTIERTTTLEANLLSGTIDMIAGELGVELDQALAFRKRHGDRYQMLFQPGLLYEHIDVDLDNPILADVRVRRALLHAANRAGLVEELFGGEQIVADTFVHPMDSPYTREGVATYPYDPERAAALLDEAGWTLSDDGIRRDASGAPLQLKLMTTAGNKSREMVEQVLQSQWRDAGIDARIENENARVFFGQTLDRREFGGLAMFAWASAPEPVPRTILHSSQIPSEANSWSGQNYTGFSDPEVDALIVTLEEELDAEARLGPWQRLQQIYAEQLPVLPLFFRTDVYILPQWLEGVRPTGHIMTSTQWIEDWARSE